MTKFLQDILRQPAELRRALGYLEGAGVSILASAASAISNASAVYLTGMGASWNAALAAAASFYADGVPVALLDASEMLAAAIPAGAAVIILSRSGASAEIVLLLEKVRQSSATSIGITNFPEGALAQRADISLLVPCTPDHGISVGTYSTLALAATALAHTVTHAFSAALVDELGQCVASLSQATSTWTAQLADAPWLAPGAAFYFLARGSSLASAYEAQLLWHEGVKQPANAMGLDSFRHGPQEVVTGDTRIAIWTAEPSRDKDLTLARDLRRLGARVLLIGQQLPTDAAELVLELPRTPPRWQFLADVVPVQLAAERLSVLAGVDCDSFRFASYIVKSDTGLSLAS